MTKFALKRIQDRAMANGGVDPVTQWKVAADAAPMPDSVEFVPPTKAPSLLGPVSPQAPPQAPPQEPPAAPAPSNHRTAEAAPNMEEIMAREELARMRAQLNEENEILKKER